jgi:hypothetical protein
MNKYLQSIVIESSFPFLIIYFKTIQRITNLKNIYLKPIPSMLNMLSLYISSLYKVDLRQRLLITSILLPILLCLFTYLLKIYEFTNWMKYFIITICIYLFVFNVVVYYLKTNIINIQITIMNNIIGILILLLLILLIIFLNNDYLHGTLIGLSHRSKLKSAFTYIDMREYSKKLDSKMFVDGYLNGLRSNNK